MVKWPHENANAYRVSRRAVAGALLVAAGVAFAVFHGVLPLPGSPAAPAADPLPGMRAGLAEARAFSAEPALQLAPRFSADGRFVAFALGDERESRIVVQALDGSSRQFVGHAGALRLSPVFFPDGRRLAFWKSTAGDCAIVEYDLRTGAESPLVDCALLPRVRFDLSPDGRRLVFTGGADPQQPGALWIVELAGGTPRALSAPGPELGDDLHPRFSPDGRHVAFFRGRDARRQPWAVAANGGTARPLTARVGAAYGLAWLPGGGLLVAADWSGEPQLHFLDPATGNARPLGAAAARFPDASRGGDLVFEQAPRGEPPARHGITEAAHVRPAGTSSAPVELMVARAKR